MLQKKCQKLYFIIAKQIVMAMYDTAHPDGNSAEFETKFAAH